MKTLVLVLLLSVAGWTQLPPCPAHSGGSFDPNNSYCFFGNNQHWGQDDFGNAVFHNLSFAVVAPPANLAIQGINALGGSLQGGTKYYWVVTATNPYGETTASNEMSITPSQNSAVRLSWSTTLGATGYNLYRGTSHGGETFCASVLAPLTAIPQASIQYVDGGATCSGGSVPSSNTSQPFIGGGGGSVVYSVFGRTGAVAAANNDYSFNQISGLLNLGTQTTGQINLGTQTTGQINLASQVTGNLPVTNLASGTNATAVTFWRGDNSWKTASNPDATIALSNPVTAMSGLAQYEFTGSGATISRVYCDTDTGTVTVNLDNRSESTPNTAGTTILTSNLVCGSTGASSSSVQNANVSANALIGLEIISLTGSPTVLRVHVQYQPN